MKRDATIFLNFLVPENNPIQLSWDYWNEKKKSCFLILSKLWNLDAFPFSTNSPHKVCTAQVIQLWWESHRGSHCCLKFSNEKCHLLWVWKIQLARPLPWRFWFRGSGVWLPYLNINMRSEWIFPLGQFRQYWKCYLKFFMGGKKQQPVKGKANT